MAEFIYTMRKARKAHGDKVILDDVTLSFLPGRQDRRGRPQRRRQVDACSRSWPGSTSRPTATRMLTPGLHRRHPRCRSRRSTRPRRCCGNVEEAVAETKAQARPLQRDRRADGRPDADFDALLAEMGELQEEIDHADALGPRLPARAGHGRAALPAAATPTSPCSPVVSAAASRCASCCWRQPDLLLLDEPTNHLDAESVQWLEQHLEKYAGTVVAVTHDRYFLDNVAEWILELDRGRAYPYEGNYSTYLETKAGAAQGRGREGRQARQAAHATSWSGCAPTPRAARPRARRASHRYEEMAAEADKTRKLDFEEIQIPPGPRLGSVVVEAKQPHQGLRRPAC